MIKKYKYLIILFLIVASFIAFGRIMGNDFINFDDNLFITENNHIKVGFNAESIKWALTAYDPDFWHPLTWLSIMMDWSLFGSNAFGHHLVSLLWHIGSVILLFLFLSKTTGSLWPSAFVAALFALHPLRVESVAWAAERKDVLSMFFGMATLYAYAYYVEKPKLSKYFLCLILFALSLMSKPMMITLPCVMLLLDYWPLCRLQKSLQSELLPVINDSGLVKKKVRQSKTDSIKYRKTSVPLKNRSKTIQSLLLEKLPFIFLAIVTSIVTIWAQSKIGVVASLKSLPFIDRTLNAIVSYVAYLLKIFWPVNLALFYPYVQDLPSGQVFGAASIMLAISIAVIYAIKKAPFLFVGWFWYLGTLVPVIGLLQVGSQAMADRYTYFPSIGIGISLAWGVVYLLPKEKMRKMILIPAAIIILAALTFLTWQQCGYWKDSISLFNHVLRATKDNTVAHTNLGAALLAEGKIDEAIAHYHKAIEIDPDFSIAHSNLASALVVQGRIDEAIAAIKINPNQEEAHFRLGVVLAAEGEKLADQRMNEEAIAQYLAAIKINPYNHEAHGGLGIVLAAQGRDEEAIAHYLAAVKIKSNYDDAYYNLANLLVKQGKIAEAIDNYHQAIKINPAHYDAHFNLASILVKEQRLEEVVDHFRQAVRIAPSFAALNNLGVNLEKQLKHDEAIYHYSKALQLEPDNPGIYFNLGVALGNKGDLKEAADNFRLAIILKPDYEDARRALKLALEMNQQ